MKYKFSSGVQVFFELILGVVGVALLLGGSLYALQTFQTALLPKPTALVNETGSTIASNATGSVVSALATVPTWITIIVPVIGVVAVIGYFAMVRPGARR